MDSLCSGDGLVDRSTESDSVGLNVSVGESSRLSENDFRRVFDGMRVNVGVSTIENDAMSETESVGVGVGLRVRVAVGLLKLIESVVVTVFVRLLV